MTRFVTVMENVLDEADSRKYVRRDVWRGVFHGFVTDGIETDEGPLLYAAAIVERDDGKVEVIGASYIRFDEPTKQQATAAHEKLKEWASQVAYGQSQIMTATAGADLRAGDLVTVYPAEPMAYRPMSELSQATGLIVVAFRVGGKDGSVVLDVSDFRYNPDEHDLGWLQLPPTPTVKL